MSHDGSPLGPGTSNPGARVEVDESAVLEERLLLRGPDAVWNRQDVPDVLEKSSQKQIYLAPQRRCPQRMGRAHLCGNVGELPDARRRDAMRGQVPAYSFVGQAVFALMR